MKLTIADCAMIAQREPMPDLSGYEQNREMQGEKKTWSTSAKMSLVSDHDAAESFVADAQQMITALNKFCASRV